MKELKDIIAKAPENDTLEVKKFLFGSIEYTTLKCTDSEQSVMAFVEQVNKWDKSYDEQSVIFYNGEIRRGATIIASANRVGPRAAGSLSPA